MRPAPGGFIEKWLPESADTLRTPYSGVSSVPDPGTSLLRGVGGRGGVGHQRVPAGRGSE